MGMSGSKEAPAGSQYHGEAAGCHPAQKHDLSAIGAHQNQPSLWSSCYDPSKLCGSGEADFFELGD